MNPGAASASTLSGKGKVEIRRLLDQLPAAAYTCDRDGLITYFNSHAARLWGREPKLHDPIDRYCGSFRLFASDGWPIGHENCWMARTIREERSYDGEEILIDRPDGTRRVALAHANPLRDEDERMIGAVNVLIDITERKQSELALRDAYRRKDEFLAILSHELRNPLAPIRNALQLLRLHGGDVATATQARGLIERQLENLVRLVDDLGDVSRIARNELTLQREPVDFVSVARSAIDAARSAIDAGGHELAISLPREAVFVDADRARLAQAFANLLTNAAKYTPRGGRIELAAQQDGEHVTATVRDNGIGIAADLLPRIFEIVAQFDRQGPRAPGGLGIGLCVARGLVEMHGGRIEARSEGEGRGSAFVVRLPILVGSRAGDPKPRPLERRDEPKADCRVIVVDDNRDSAASFAMMLKLFGADVATADDGRQTLELARNFRPHVMLLDIGLPDISGYDLARAIRSEEWGREVLLAAITGWGQDEDKRRSIEAGFDLHLVKPVDPAALEGVLASFKTRPRTTARGG